MSVLETVERVGSFLERNRRVSYRMLRREFDLDEEALEELIGELVDVQRVAAREGSVLVWAGDDPAAATPGSRVEPERDLRAYTPKHLADKILQSKSALEGERKQVTVLFADVKGSMELQEDLDPEQWHAILDRFFQILTEGVHRFEGTVNQYLGDGIMALFGAPIAHEDHAQRACYAALHLRDELRPFGQELRREHGIEFSVRMGLNSGEVIVGKIGDDLRMDYTAQGHTVGLAERMEQLAEEGRPYLGPETASLVEGYFEIEELGEFRVKGAGEPLAAFALTGAGPARTRLDVSRARGFTRFVGRRDEMTSLEAALRRALEGRGQVVGVVGEAGVGKSRLCSEFADRCRAREIALYDAHCPAHGQSVPLLPVFELLRGYFGIAERDPDRLAREKIAGRLLLLDRAFDETLPLVFDFVGVPDPDRPAPQMDPEARQRQLFAFLRRLVQARSEQEPAVLLFDDLHWIDAASDGFLAQLVDATSSTRTLVLVNFRPGYTAEWTHKSYYQQLPLAPLGPDEVAAMLTDLLGSDASVAPLPALIQEKAEGNPFFTEEVMQSLVESGPLAGERGAYRLVRPLGDLHVPATVQAVLAARIDRLPEQDKQVLQTAAVIGREFGEPLLSAVVELPAGDLASSLSRLQSSEFIVEQAIYPVAEYAFKHPLTEQVARESQLQERRARTHADVARALETYHAEKLDENAALLAYHWEQAGEPGEAARWHRRAAEWAGMSHASEALRHWRQVRNLLRSVDESPETIELRVEAVGQILTMSVRSGVRLEDARELLDEAQELVRRSRDPRAQARFQRNHGLFLGYSGWARESLEILREAIRLADETGDDALRVGARYAIVIPHFYTGRLREGLAAIDEALELLRRDRDLGAHLVGYDPLTAMTAFRGAALAEMGRLEESARASNRAVELARAGNDRAALSMAHWASGWTAEAIGDSASALAHLRRAVELAESLGTAVLVGIDYTVLGRAHVLERNWDEAIAAFELARERGIESAGPLFWPWLAVAWLEKGDAGRARSIVEQALSFARERGAEICESRAQVALARVLVASEGAKARERVEAALERAESLVRATGAAAHTPTIHLARAELARVLGDEATRGQELREAHRLYTEMGATGRAERVARELEETGA